MASTAEARLTAIYSKIDAYDGSAEKAALSAPHDASLWADYFARYNAERREAAIRGMRLVISAQTEAMLVKLRLRASAEAVDVVHLDASSPLSSAENEYFTDCGGGQAGIGDAEDVSRWEKPLELVADNHIDDAQQLQPWNTFGIAPSEWPAVSPENQMRVEVWESDSLEAWKRLVDDKLALNPCVLNMASSRRPGGGWRTGAGAQEENLFRRSDYANRLEAPSICARYPLPEYGGIYSRHVTVWRGPEATGYAVLPDNEWLHVSFIAVGAYRAPRLVVTHRSYCNDDRPIPCKVKKTSKHARRTENAHRRAGTKMEDDDGLAAHRRLERNAKKKQVASRPQHTFMGQNLRLPDRIADGTRNKIRAILNIALYHGHDSCVLGALGCGAYGQPPFHVALLFREILEREFKGCFRMIVFAIIEDHNSRRVHNPDGNLMPFQHAFRSWHVSE